MEDALVMTTGRRATDKHGWQVLACWLAVRASELWEWIDKRDIDAHMVAGFLLYATYKITAWCMGFAETSARPGMEVAAIIGAILVPWSGLQAVAVKWYFEKRRRA